MTVKIDGLELEVQTSGIIHSSGEDISFVLENEKDNPKNPVLRFVSRPAAPNLTPVLASAGVLLAAAAKAS